MMPVIAVDVDGVCADLHVEWLKRYNRDYDDCLTIEGVKGWGMEAYVKPECGKAIYKYLSDPDLYANVPVIEGSQDGVAALREKGYRVVFLTSCTKGMTDQKWDWLEQHGFLQSRGNADLIVAHDKSLIRANLLIDDYDGNFKGWQGSGILLSAPYNAHFDPPYHIVRVDNWSAITKLVQVAVTAQAIPYALSL
jgi:5'-nucleotidase